MWKILGWNGCYAFFEIGSGMLPNGRSFKKNFWLLMEVDGLMKKGGCHTEYRLYEDVQKDLGRGLVL